MENLGVQFWIQIIIYGISFGTIYGTINTRLKYMEQKLDKHNHLVERMYGVENICSNNIKDIEEIKIDIKDIKAIVNK